MICGIWLKNLKKKRKELRLPFLFLLINVVIALYIGLIYKKTKKMETKVLKNLALRAKNLEVRCKGAAKEIQKRLVANETSEKDIVSLLTLNLVFLCNELRDLIEVFKILERETENDEEAKNFIVSLVKETENTLLSVINEFKEEEV